MASINDSSVSQSAPGGPEKPHHHGSFGSRIRNYFLTGLIVAGPVAITIWLTWSFVNWVDNVVRPFIPVAYRPESALTLLGFLTANLVGRTLVEAGERILDRMPLVRSIYKGLKQVFETLFSQSGSSFRKVGLVEFPSPGMWSLVFMSQPPSAEITSVLPNKEEHVSVFMPCTPNPTTGFFFYVARSAVIELDIPVEAAAKLIMSAGLIQPTAADGPKRLAALAEAAKAAQTAQLPKPAAAVVPAK